jgi:hypothetical protein
MIIIANAKYADQETTSIFCEIDGTECFVPTDPANTDYAEIMRQVNAGTLTIEDAD